MIRPFRFKIRAILWGVKEKNMAQQYGLGRGLSSLIPPKRPDVPGATQNVAGNQGVNPSVLPVQPVAKQPASQSPFVINPVQRTGISETDPASITKTTSPRVEPVTPSRPAVIQSSEGTTPEKAVSSSAPTSLHTRFDQEGITNAPLHKIVPNPEQPRARFDKEKLAELAQSIREHGILQPLVVTRSGDGYELIAGERRLQAAKLAGLTEVPVIVRSADERTKLELAIIENTQRHNLNPIEEAKAYLRLMEEYGLHQEEVAKKMGKSRSLVANTVRLLHLPVEIQRALIEGKISEGHAKALLSIENPEKQRALFEMILKSGLTVRETEVEARSVSVRPHVRSEAAIPPEFSERLEKLREKLGTRVRLSPAGQGGKIVIEYYSPEELQGLFQRFGL